MSARFAKQPFIKPLLGSLALCLAGIPFATADIGTGMPPAPSTSPDGTTPMTDIHDIKPALGFGAQWPWWVWLLIVLTIAAFVALAWWWRRRRNQKSDTVNATPALPAEQEAFQQLDALASEGNSDPKRYYFTLSAVLRRYVERRFDFPAAEMTTEELLPRIRRLSVADNLVQTFKQFCLSSDPVKFADATADQSRMREDMVFARHFVEQTTIAATAVEDNESGIPPANVPGTTPPKPLLPQKPMPGERSV